MDPQKTALSLAGTLVFDCGEIAKYSEKAVRKALAKSEVRIEIDLGVGNFSAIAYGCDMTEGYIKINAEYN